MVRRPKKILEPVKQVLLHAAFPAQSFPKDKIDVRHLMRVSFIVEADWLLRSYPIRTKCPHLCPDPHDPSQWKQVNRTI